MMLNMHASKQTCWQTTNNFCPTQVTQGFQAEMFKYGSLWRYI